jgi:prepilin-type N-terminal cleavage/methylation domain-containing protein
MKLIKRNQSGFTLVEIAIVLVIIGLLLGGVLKGQEMIENGRIKSVVNDMVGVSAAHNAYLDRFHAIAGDETAATMTARGWAGTLGGNGDGVLVIPVATTFTNAGEQTAFWRALRASGLAAGDPAAAVGVVNQPRAGTGGLLGISSAPYGLLGVSACVSGLTTKQASGVDVIIDGTLPANQIGNSVGNGARGATGAVNPLPPVTLLPTGLAYNETTTVTPWTICRPL